MMSVKNFSDAFFLYHRSYWTGAKKGNSKDTVTLMYHKFILLSICTMSSTMLLAKAVETR